MTQHPITIILSGKWSVADRELVGTTTHITLYCLPDEKDESRNAEGYLTKWQHLDGTPCNAGFLSKRHSPSESTHWWCTEHQKYLTLKTQDGP